MKHDFSIWQLLKFTFFVASGIGGLPLLIDSLDGFSAKTRLPVEAHQSLAIFGGMIGAIVYFFTIPANISDDKK